MLRRLAAALCLLLPLHVALAGLVAPCASGVAVHAESAPEGHGTSHHGEDSAPEPVHGKTGCLATATCSVVMIPNASVLATDMVPDDARDLSPVEAWASVTRAPELPPPRG